MSRSSSDGVCKRECKLNLIYSTHRGFQRFARSLFNSDDWEEQMELVSKQLINHYGTSLVYQNNEIPLGRTHKVIRSFAAKRLSRFTKPETKQYRKDPRGIFNPLEAVLSYNDHGRVNMS